MTFAVVSKETKAEENFADNDNPNFTILHLFDISLCCCFYFIRNLDVTSYSDTKVLYSTRTENMEGILSSNLPKIFCLITLELTE